MVDFWPKFWKFLKFQKMISLRLGLFRLDNSLAKSHFDTIFDTFWQKLTQSDIIALQMPPNLLNNKSFCSSSSKQYCYNCQRNLQPLLNMGDASKDAWTSEAEMVSTTALCTVVTCASGFKPSHAILRIYDWFVSALHVFDTYKHG